MKPKMILKLTVDIGMTAALLLLMAYELVGQAAHEWIGIGMFVLFVIHHILNGSWIRNLLRGRYNPVRIMQTGLVLLILCAMAGLMVSGIILSRHALSFLPIKGGRSFARNLHMLSAYWGSTNFRSRVIFYTMNVCMMYVKNRIYPASRSVYMDDQEIELTRMEFDVLYFLASNPNIAFTKEQIYDAVNKDEYSGGAYIVRDIIYRLRTKLKITNIRTLHGYGYKFSTDNGEDSPMS